MNTRPSPATGDVRSFAALYFRFMKLASVILDIPTQALDAPYTYAVPEGGEAVEVGCAVVVPFGHRKAVGFVIDVREYADDSLFGGGLSAGGFPGGGLPAGGFPVSGSCSLFDDFTADGPTSSLPQGVDPAKLKAISQVVSKPYFDEEGAACAQWMAQRYIAPLSSCVRLFTPPGGVPRMVRAKEGYWRLEQPTVGEVDDRWVVRGPAFEDFEPRKNAVKQASIVEALRGGDLRMAELTTEFGSVSSVVKALESKGVVRVELRRRMRGMVDASCVNAPANSRDIGAPGSNDSHDFVSSQKPQLTEGQAAALAAINAAREAGRGDVVLVDGVTGSGKTEVYLQAIEATLAAGRTAIVLVPEISLTPQTVGRFRGRFGDMVAVMHSRMSQGERFDQWDFIRSGAARVVVGARSALFTPLRNLGLIVIDEEHEGSYKQDSAPRYVSRDVAAWMVRRCGGALVLGSATPSIESLYACAKDPEHWHHVLLPERANGRPLPAVEVIDMASEFRGGSRSMFARKLVTALRNELARGRKAVLLLNQRGFAKFLLCRDCGFVPECPSCSTSLTYHERGSFLACHHCGYRAAVPPVCPECGSPYLKKFGAGTQRVEAELRALLDGMPDVGPNVPIIRMDADTTTGKGAHQRLLEEFAAADAAVLLGTQMIAKGLDFDDVTLVGVVNADTQLHLPDYRAGERTFSLIEQVAGRAGRAELAGRVLVQTYEADSLAIRAAAAYDRSLFLRDELPKRKVLGYPPYVRMANVLVWGADEEKVRLSAQELQERLRERVHDHGGEGWYVLPASPCVLAKLRNTYRWHVVVKAPLSADLPSVIAPVFRERKADARVNVAVDVDPEDLL